MEHTQFAGVHAAATRKAAEATQDFLAQHGDRDLCGFAWVTVYNVKLSSKLGKAMAAQGFRKAYGGGIQLWNPSGSMTQNITAKEQGAEVYARVLRDFGLEAYAGSRLD